MGAVHSNIYNMETILFQSDFNSNTPRHISKTTYFSITFLKKKISHSPGHHYLTKIDGKYHAGTIENGFKGLHDNIDAAFAHENHIHIIKVSANKIRHFHHAI